jgi:hypothetical protein
MQILYQKSELRPERRALLHRGNQWYDGWTGYEYFGCLSPHRYFGWQLHCWAQIYVEAFTDIRQSIFFARVEDALDSIDRLMDFADSRGRLSRKPVKYFNPDEFGPRIPLSPEIETAMAAGLKFISEHRPILDIRMPSDSPAHWRRLRQIFPPDKSLTREQEYFQEWQFSASPPEFV